MINIDKIISNKKPSKEDLDKIEKLLNKCCHIYYNTDMDSPLTDEEFDKLLNYFNSYRKFSTTTAPSSSKRIIDVSHMYPELVGTLEKANEISQIKGWLYARLQPDIEYEIMVSYKEDGNSITGTFDKQGRPLSFLTRGKDGKGADMTKYFKHITIPPVSKKSEFGIKFEAIMTDNDFNEYNELYYTKHERYLSNSRSAVAGILGNDEGYKYSKFIKLVPLAIKFKDGYIGRKDSLRLIDVIGTINKDFSPLEYKVFKGTRDKLVEDINHFYQVIIDEKRPKLNRPIDGIVIELLSDRLRDKLGRLDDKNKFDIALKFPYEVKRSHVINIEFYSGPTGRITPVVVFEDLIFNGATCNRVSIANYKRFKELKLKVGDEVKVSYRNDVLSYLENNVDIDKEGKLIKFITNCPDCGEKLVFNKTKTFVFCKNNNCPNIVKGKIVNWLSKINVKGIKENTIEKLINAGLLHSIEDLYSLTAQRIELVDGFKEKSANNIIDSLNKRKDIYDYELLGSLMIENFGRKNAKLLFKNYSFKEIFKYLKDGSLKNKIIDIKGFEEITATYIVEGLKSNLNTIKALTKVLNIKSSKPKENNGVSYKIVFTGLRDKALQQQLEDLGHTVVGSVSKQTDYLIAKDPNGSSSSIKKAKELNKPILTIEEFKKQFNL